MRSTIALATTPQQSSLFLQIFFFLTMLHGIWDLGSPIRDQSRTPALKQNLNHWTAREVPTNLHFSLLSRSCLDDRWPFPPHQYSHCFFFSFILPPLLSQSPKPEASQQSYITWQRQSYRSHPMLKPLGPPLWSRGPRLWVPNSGGLGSTPA